MPEMKIERVAFRTPSFENNLRIVILKQKNGMWCLPVWLSPVEANDVLLSLRETPLPGPLPHELIENVANKLGGIIQHITIYKTSKESLGAKIGMQTQNETLELESRPSDAICIAIRAQAPIHVEQKVLDNTGVCNLTTHFEQLVKNPDYRLANLWIAQK